MNNYQSTYTYVCTVLYRKDLIYIAFICGCRATKIYQFCGELQNNVVSISYQRSFLFYRPEEIYFIKI